MHPHAFRDRLRQALAERTATAYWLSRQIGASPQAVLNLLTEDGPALPSLARACAIADALGVSLDWLAGRDNHAQEKSAPST